MFKLLTEAFKPDSRFANMVSRVDASVGIQLWSIADQHDLMKALDLAPSVPHEVRELFDAARNTFIYAWFDYELHTVAEQYSYVVVEMALKERHRLAQTPLPKRQGLAALIRSARKCGWIKADNYEIPAPHMAGGTFSMLDFLCASRNHIVHGNRQLSPWASQEAMTWCAMLINELFSTASTAAST